MRVNTGQGHRDETAVSSVQCSQRHTRVNTGICACTMSSLCPLRGDRSHDTLVAMSIPSPDAVSKHHSFFSERNASDYMRATQHECEGWRPARREGDAKTSVKRMGTMSKGQMTKPKTRAGTTGATK